MDAKIFHYHQLSHNAKLLSCWAWTHMSPTTSWHRISSAIIRPLKGVWDSYWLVKEPQIFVSSYANWDHCIRVFLPASSSRWKKLHWPLLSIASICKQLFLLQMEMRPKIATNGAMPLNADVLCFLPRVHMPDQINFNPSADRTDISFRSSLLKQFVLSRGPRNNCMSKSDK